MEKIKILDRIKELYSSGGNLIQYLKSLNVDSNNSLEDILISYDFQAGVYTKKAMNDPDFRNEICQNLASVLDELTPFDSILEIGVGEATTLGKLLLFLKNNPERIFGFDLSWSRIKYARKFLSQLNLKDQSNIQLSTGDLFNAPFGDHSIDIVYTAHSLEPNGGSEEKALKELYRIAKKYVVLLEPAYELASKEAQERMRDHGYVTDLYGTAQRLGYEVLTYRLFQPISNPLNPTGLMIIKKEVENNKENKAALACPITKSPLDLIENAYYSKTALLAYPIIKDIPCLLPQNAIIASHFLD